MRKIFLILFLINISSNLFAQPSDNFEKLWESVGKLMDKGLTKSALAEVNKIYETALKSNNEPEQVKAVMFKMHLSNSFNEGNQEPNIFFLDTLILTSQPPLKNIYQSMNAEMLWIYLTQRGRLSNTITPLQKVNKNEDITTWSNLRITNKIENLYKSSIQNQNLLSTIPISNFDTILIKGNARELRPTLYDFLAHRAIDYFKSFDSYVSKPSYSFIIDDVLYFSPANEFININLNTKDTSSLKFIALQIYQRLLKLHINDNHPEALINIELERLEFVYNAAVVQKKDSIYEDALLKLENKFHNNKAIAEAIFLRANLHYTKGINSFNPTSDEIIKSKIILENAISRFPNSSGAIKSQNLLNEILMPSLGLKVEKVNTPGPFRTLLTYKNISKVYFRIIKTSNSELKDILKNDDSDFKKYLNLKYMKSWSQILPNPDDYRTHSAEVKIDSLGPGVYLILTSIEEDFNTQKNIIIKALTYISNISYIENNKNDFYILNRSTGFPLKGAKLKLFQRNYNYKKRNYEEVLKGTYTADNNGHISFKPSKEYNSYTAQIIFKDEALKVDDDNVYLHDFNSYKKTKSTSAFLFTDRAIYRPGQNIYFKGIVYSTDTSGLKSQVVPQHPVNILLFDANYQKIGNLKLTTNNFGSYNGFFKLPEDGLTGNFFIKDSVLGISQNFSVEEYKRPKFQTIIDTPKGTYKLNDSITVHGKATAYAGNNIDAATVTYRVIRKVNYPIWLYSYSFGKIFPPYNRDQMEVANGNTLTDDNGDFEIKFKAIPDESVDKNNQPVFNYEVIADVTDINGETRSSSIIISVSYQNFSIEIEGDEIINDLSDIKIKTLNSNKVFEKELVSVIVNKLVVPNKIYRERLWEKPDQFTLSKDEFEKYFPFDVYNNEDQISEWKVEKNIINKSDSTTISGLWNWPKEKLEQGWYKITVNSKDKNGEVVKAERFIKIAGNNALSNEPLNLITDKTSYRPGEQASYSIQSAFDKNFLITSVRTVNDKNKNTYNLITNQTPLNSQINITESNRGGIAINTVFVKHNRIYSENLFIKVPWDNKDLNISLETWRDKLNPGENETWKIKIKGSNRDNVASEALINMYDASLDQFKPHSWQLIKGIWPATNNYFIWNMQGENYEEANLISSYNPVYLSNKELRIDELLDNGWKYIYKISTFYGATTMVRNSESAKVQSEVKDALSKDSEKTDTITNTPKFDDINIRKDFRETAFFFPDLKTDEQGNISFSFKTPEALTLWKLMIQAHTKDLKSAYIEKNIITQKPLMLQPNIPRFLREGDKIEIPAKIVNITDTEISGTVQLELLDALTNKPVDGWFANVFPMQYFTAEAGKSAIVKFPITIPVNYNSALVYKIKSISRDGKFSDGEQDIIPVLTNKKLVTETLPINVRGTGTRKFKFEKLLQSGNSETLKNNSLTIEYTSNPSWFVVQALPYLNEIKFPSSDQYFTAFYANTLAAFIANSSPQLKSVFNKWQEYDTSALKSNLEKNQELKSALISETPWVLEAKTETQQKHNIAMLFKSADQNQNKFLSKLKNEQTPNGGFSWFKGGPDDRYITTYITTGIGKLIKIGAVNKNKNELQAIAEKALSYLDARIKDEYDDLLKSKADLSKNNLSYSAIQYLYMRSFFEDYKLNANSLIAKDYYFQQAKKYWLSQNYYMQATIATILFRKNDKTSADAILKSLLENSINDDETGIHWANQSRYRIYWYQAPVESQAMMIEAFSEITNDNSIIDNLKTWLLKNKQTNNWETSKATADACYSLLLKGSNWISDEKEISIKVGDLTLITSQENTEAGTGYFKKIIDGNLIRPNMGNIEVDVKTKNQQHNNATSWGGIYWQYFEDLDKITNSDNSLSVTKELFTEVNTDKGPVLGKILNGQNIKTGEKVVVRIVLKTDRDLEFVHLKDMRSAGLEPVDVLSGFFYNNNAGYYKNTLDASTNYFFNRLNKGSYVFEYSTFASQEGDFSNGITTVQCLYAPEFTSHSEGIRINIEK